MKRILIVDDSNTNVVLLEAVLNNRGYDIRTSMSVKEAYGILADEPPELILLDLLMPQISGYQFLDQIKSDEKTKHIPVIIISAVTDALNIKKTLDMGALDYIEKPVDIKELITKVERTLN
jgi:CheY-like chemotaxis protein